MTEERVATREQYSNTANPRYEALLAQGTIHVRLPALLAQLRPSTRVLDCGCGPGSVTLSLAEVVAPGAVVGLDFQESQVEMARRFAAERGIGSVSFRQGSIYELPFPDASFDAVCAFAVLFHLREPLRALREMRRVLKPGGVTGVVDPDGGGDIFEPWSPLAASAFALHWRAHEFNGGDAPFGRKQRRLLTAAGLVRVEIASLAFSPGTPAALADHVEFISLRVIGPAYVEAIVGQGWATREQLGTILDGFRAWAARPDAYRAELFCTAIGWAPD